MFDVLLKSPLIYSGEDEGMISLCCDMELVNSYLAGIISTAMLSKASALANAGFLKTRLYEAPHWIDESGIRHNLSKQKEIEKYAIMLETIRMRLCQHLSI